MYSIDPVWLRDNLIAAKALGAVGNRAPLLSTIEGSKGKVALMDISGPLDYRESWITQYFGGTGYDRISEILAAGVADKKIETILMRIQSPGGSAMGATELHYEIAQAAKKKRVVAFVDPYAFSAAYQIASAATEIVATPSGMVGSVGAYAMHVDYSEALKADGVNVSFIFAGEKKVDGNAYEPLSDRARADMQREVDFFYEGFVADVASGRKTSAQAVKENFGQGGRVLANQALSAGMIDRILPLNELIQGEVLSALNGSFLSVGRPQNSPLSLQRAKSLVELEELEK